MTDSTRRRFLRLGGMAGTLGVAGCLRLSGTNSPTATTESGQTDATDDAASTATTAGTTRTSGETFDAEQFYMTMFDSDGSLYDDAKLDVHTADEDLELGGTWSGDRRVFSSQACARYSFDLLESGSPVASTGEQILVFGYQYALAQSADAAFITYQPSVGADWDHTLNLTYRDGEHTITPEIRSDEGVFEFDFANSDIDPGRYAWTFEITPPDSFTIEIGTFNERLVSVSPNDSDSFPSRDEAMQNAAEAANAEATPVSPPQTTRGNGLETRESGHGGGGPGDIAGQYITRDVRVECESDCSFGPGTDRQFRINNRTTQTSLTFTPE